MSRAHRLIGFVSLILLVASCRDSVDPTTHDAGRPVADVVSAASNAPSLFYSTYLGGSGDDLGFSIAVDASGNAYVTGTTSSSDFPTTSGVFQPMLTGYPGEAFVTKLNPTGSGLVYSTYLGGSDGLDIGYGIAVDATGNAYMTGTTYSTNFPTLGAFQALFGGGFQDAFVTKLNATGSALVYSSFLGGSGYDQGLGIAVDATDNAYVTGLTQSTNFPTTLGAFRTTAPGIQAAFVTKVNTTGSLIYSTYLGGSGYDFGGSSIAVDATSSAYVTGATLSTDFPTTFGAFQTTAAGNGDAFATKLNAAGSALLYSTYLGASGFEAGIGIAVDATGSAHVLGHTQSTNFPTLGAFQGTYGGGAVDAFVTKFNPPGSALVYSTYLGGSGDDFAGGIRVNATGNAYVTGFTSSTNFPITLGAFQPTAAGSVDAFVTKLNAAGSGLDYSTYLGGAGEDEGLGIALDALPNPNAHVTGYTRSTNFPTTPGAFQTAFGGGDYKAFVAKIIDVGLPPPPTVGKVTGGGSINVAGGTGTFGFIMQRQAVDASIRGNLEYVNHASGAKVQSVMFNSFVIAGNTATFGGTCTNNGAPCTFTVNVTDNDEPGLTDTFTISVSGGPTEGGTLRSGNIQVHKTQ
jgi:hypothetical protein